MKEFNIVVSTVLWIGDSNSRADISTVKNVRKNNVSYNPYVSDFLHPLQTWDVSRKKAEKCPCLRLGMMTMMASRNFWAFFLQFPVFSTSFYWRNIVKRIFMGKLFHNLIKFPFCRKKMKYRNETDMLHTLHSLNSTSYRVAHFKRCLKLSLNASKAYEQPFMTSLCFWKFRIALFEFDDKIEEVGGTYFHQTHFQSHFVLKIITTISKPQK